MGIPTDTRPADRPQVAGPTASTPATPPPANPAGQTVASVAGAVASTLVTSQLGGSPAANLAAAALGAAIPPFVTYAGPWRKMRLGAASAIIALAFALTYGGVSAVDAATDAKTFPGPVEPPEPQLAPEPGPRGGTGPGPVVTQPKRPGIQVTPDAVTCTPEGCEPAVVIQSTRATDLRVADIQVGGTGREQFPDEYACEHSTIDRDEPCRFEVTYTPAPDGSSASAQLVIHHDAGKEPATVQLEGSGGPVRPDGDVAFVGEPTCTVENGQTARISLSALAPDGVTAVPVTVSDAGGTTLMGRSVAPGGPADFTIDLGIEPTESVFMTVNLDPDGSIDEADEENNSLPVECARP